MIWCHIWLIISTTYILVRIRQRLYIAYQKYIGQSIDTCSIHILFHYSTITPFSAQFSKIQESSFSHFEIYVDRGRSWHHLTRDRKIDQGCKLGICQDRSIGLTFFRQADAWAKNWCFFEEEQSIFYIGRNLPQKIKLPHDVDDFKNGTWY